jgi:hypothetical protein
VPEVDVWPQIQGALRARGPARLRRIPIALAATLLLATASVAVADSPVRLSLTPANPAPGHVGAVLETSVRTTIADADRRAGFTTQRAPEGEGTRLVSAEYIAPITEILGRPVVNPQPHVRLTYATSGGTVIVDEQRNPRPGEPMLLVPLGQSDGGRIERDGSAQRYVHYTVGGDRVDFMVWGTQELWIRVTFEPAFDAARARLFVGALQ